MNKKNETKEKIKEIIVNKKTKSLEEKIKETIENPDLMTCKCKEHVFYVKKFDGKMMLVYAKRKRGKYSVECMDFLINIKGNKK